MGIFCGDCPSAPSYHGDSTKPRMVCSKPCISGGVFRHHRGATSNKRLMGNTGKANNKAPPNPEIYQTRGLPHRPKSWFQKSWGNLGYSSSAPLMVV